MFGAYLRGALNLALGALVGALLSYALGLFLPYMGAESSILYRSFEGVANNATLVMILAAIVTVLARANVERRLGGA